MSVFRYVYILCVLLLVACNGGQSSSQGTTSPPSGNGSVIIGSIPTIPSSTSHSNYVMLPILNNMNQQIILDSVQITSNNVSLLPVSQYIDASECASVSPGETCYLKLFTDQINGFLININYKDAGNAQINVKQLVNFSSNLPETDGVIPPITTATMQTNSLLSIPILLDRPYSGIKAELENTTVPVICDQANNPNMCSVIVNSAEVNEVSKLRVTVYDSSDITQTTNYITTLTVSNNASGHIITSVVNPVISPANGTSPITVTLFNNGTATASAINIYANTPISTQSSNCSTTLPMNQTCTFQINATSSISGQSSVIISYTNTQGNQAVTINTSYISAASSALLTLTPSGNGTFNNTPVNQGYAYMMVNVKNTGSTTLQNLLFNNLNIANSAMSSFVNGSTCANGGSLSVNSSCNMILTYNPTVIESGSVNFIVTGTYSGRGGDTLTYSNSSLTILYSSISTGTFKAVGDFGMVITSPAGGAGGTWTANVDSPFATTSISGNNMLINNNNYIMTLSNGLIKYSTMNGLFWQTSPVDSTGALNSSSCQIVYDGSYYYTCGMVGTAFASVCTTTGKGCIIRTNNLNSNWSPLYTATTTVAINNIFYYSSGGNSAYVASIANAIANTGLATSSNGSSWTSTSSGQSTPANNNFFPVVFNSGNNMLTAWDSVGFSSAQSITSLSTAWNPSAVRPAAIKINGAIYQSNNYILAASNGNIYTTTDPTGSYTQSQNPANESQLNGVVYASGINSGTYVAVGNSGLNITATDPTAAWAAQTLLVTGQAKNPNLTGLFYDGSALWATGVSAIFKSTNATTWITPGLQSITKNGSNYLAVDNLGKIYSSSNASTWTQQSNPSSNVLNYIYCALQNVCFAVGNGGTILKTIDGSAWVQLSSGTNTNLNGITCQNGTCLVVGGTGSSNSGTVLSSSDYTSWSSISSSLATTGLNAITFFNGVYYAVGNTGTLFSSNNGTNWSSMTSPTSNSLYGIACNTYLGCVGVGSSGTLIFSATGSSSWSVATSGTPNDFRSVAYSSGMFVAVAKGGLIKVSSVGSSGWTNATFPTTSSNANNLNAVISDN